VVRKQVNVVGAVIVRSGEVLCAKRGPSGSLAGHWEFPGGKVEPGETPRAALEREIAEELACTVDVGAELTTTTHRYDFGVVTLTTFWCELIKGVPQLLEHAEVRWFPPSELEGLDWAPADAPAVRRIVAGASAGLLRPNQVE
jgi:8-oxo-dGTP diphosphatase